MRDQKLYESVGKYIDKYYIDKPDDIKLDKEMKSIFDRISEFRKKKATKKCDAEEDTDIEIDESAVESFDVESMQKTKATDSMSSTLATNRNIESLMGQMDETFSQRLLRLIDERGMTDSEAYNKAYVDRRHFSKIRKDVNYTPNKKTVLAFEIALELSIDEAKDLLNSAGFAFSRSSKTDIIVAYFLQNGITDKFWELCNLFFGYQSDKPSIDDLAASMIVTYAASSLKGTVPAVFKPYILKKRNDVVVFIRNIMDNRNLKDSYDALAEKVNKTLRFVAKVQEDLKKDNEKSKDRSLQLADIFACDAFAGFDDIIIEWALRQLDDEILDSQIDGLSISQIADQRSSMAYHYCDTYKYEYRAIKFAYMMMKSVALMRLRSG